MRPNPDGRTLTSAGNYDAKNFLREVLEGERQWYGPDETGFAFGSGWARPEDVKQVQAAHRRATSPSVPAPATAVVQSPAPTEISTPTDEPQPKRQRGRAPLPPIQFDSVLKTSNTTGVPVQRCPPRGSMLPKRSRYRHGRRQKPPPLDADGFNG